MRFRVVVCALLVLLSCGSHTATVDVPQATVTALADGQPPDRCSTRDVGADDAELVAEMDRVLRLACPLMARFDGWVVVASRGAGEARLGSAGEERVITLYAPLEQQLVAMTLAHELAHMVLFSLDVTVLRDWAALRGLPRVRPLTAGDYLSAEEDLAESMAAVWCGEISPFVAELTPEQAARVAELATGAGLPPRALAS